MRRFTYDSPIGSLRWPRGAVRSSSRVAGSIFSSPLWHRRGLGALAAHDLTSPRFSGSCPRQAGWDEDRRASSGAAAAWLDGYFAGEGPLCRPRARGTDFRDTCGRAMDAIWLLRTYGKTSRPRCGTQVCPRRQAVGGAVGRNPAPDPPLPQSRRPPTPAATRRRDVTWLLAHEEAERR